MSIQLTEPQADDVKAAAAADDGPRVSIEPAATPLQDVHYLRPGSAVEHFKDDVIVQTEGGVPIDIEIASVHGSQKSSRRSKRTNPVRGGGGVSLMTPGTGARKRWHLLQSYASLKTAGIRFGSDLSETQLDEHAEAFGIRFSPDSFVERHVTTVKDVLHVVAELGPSEVCWLHFSSPSHELMEVVSQRMGLHHLLAERVLDSEQRPKFEEDSKATFLQLKHVTFRRDALELTSNQVSIVLLERVVLSFSELPMDAVLEELLESLRSGGRARRLGADYIAYAVADAVFDEYFAVLEDLAEVMENLEVGWEFCVYCSMAGSSE
jgi:hypothetical protein